MLEQTGRKNIIIINGVAETFAERAVEHDTIQNESREDTVNSVCTVIAESCVSQSILQTYKLHIVSSQSALIGPRPILV